jgi:hypothetical protein
MSPNAVFQERFIADLAIIVCIAFDHRASAEGLRKFKECIEHCRFVEATMDVAGAYDLIVQGSCTSLDEYSEQIERIRPYIAEFAERLDVNFISATRSHKDQDGGEALWLPCEGGHKRIQPSMIDKVEAEGDYMRVFVGEWSCLLHDTMNHLTERLPSAGFIKLHRSSLVRISFIERLLHEGHRWTARLQDGSRVNIAKSRVRPVLRLITPESSLREVNSSHVGSSAESWGNPTEKCAALAK